MSTSISGDAPNRGSALTGEALKFIIVIISIINNFGALFDWNYVRTAFAAGWNCSYWTDIYARSMALTHGKEQWAYQNELLIALLSGPPTILLGPETTRQNGGRPARSQKIRTGQQQPVHSEICSPFFFGPEQVETNEFPSRGPGLPLALQAFASCPENNVDASQPLLLPEERIDPSANANLYVGISIREKTKLL